MLHKLLKQYDASLSPVESVLGSRALDFFRNTVRGKMFAGKKYHEICKIVEKNRELYSPRNDDFYAISDLNIIGNVAHSGTYMTRNKRFEGKITDLLKNLLSKYILIVFVLLTFND